MKLDLFAEMQRFALLICKPSYQEGLTEDQIKREQYLSVINLYAMPIFLIMNLFVFWFNPGYPLQTLAIVTAVQVLIITIFLVSCRFSLRIYKHINAFILVLLGPALFTFSPDNLLISMIIGLLVPGYTLIISQDHFLTIASFITQLISLIHLYIPAYKRKIYDSDFDQVNEFVDQHLNLVVLGQTFIVSMNIILYSVYKNYSSWLQEARMKSESALTLQEKFFFKFSHELKNPLTGLLGNLEMAYGENLDPRVRTLISNAKVCGELLLQLINNILDSGKMELGNLEMNYTPVKVNEILEKIWGICGEMIKNKGLYGQLTVYKKVPQVLLLDSIRFLQIMLNLVRNAVRFTNSGRISVTVNWIEGTEITNSTFEPIPYDDDEGLFEKEEVIGTLLRSSGRKEDDNKPAFVLDTKQRHIPEAVDSPTHAREAKKGILKIIVSDTGIGLDEESVKGIFKLFPDLINKQVRENLAVKGLSMWITHQICEKMNGEIRLYSKQGRGSTFIVCILTESPRVELPVNNLQLGADEVEFGSEERATNTKLRALVMDDNPYNTDVLKKYLEKSQVDVVGCTKNGLEALNLYQRELAEGRMIHIITMDLDMPLLDGKTACEKIRAYEAAHNRPPCTILIVSGNCFETEIKECLDPAGKIKANHFIRKPMYFLEFQRLMASIQTHHAQNFRGPFHPKKVLIVDDDLFNLQFLGRLLNMDKHEYFEARNGKEAVDIYRKNWKDIMVIFMDCEMIVMDGYTATREIRKLQDKNKLPKIKIYGVTGHTGLEHENKCKEAGMNQILSKPFRHDNVRKIVNECLHELE